MKNTLMAGICSLLLLPAVALSRDIAEPFTVGTFEINGSPDVGIGLRGRVSLDLEQANAAQK